MAYTLVFAPVVVREDMPSLDREILDRVRDAIDSKLKTRPDIFGKPLRHVLRNHKALRVTDYRIVYRIDGSTIHIIAIVHRRDVYRVAGMRV